MISKLTKNGVIEFLRGNTEIASIFQVTKLIPMGKENRYRILVSDGEHETATIAGKRMGSLVREGKLNEYGLIKVTDCVLHETKNKKKKMLVLLNFSVVEKSLPEILGTPKKISFEDVSSPPQRAIPHNEIAKPPSFSNEESRALPDMNKMTSSYSTEEQQQQQQQQEQQQSKQFHRNQPQPQQQQQRFPVTSPSNVKSEKRKGKRGYGSARFARDASIRNRTPVIARLDQRFKDADVDLSKNELTFIKFLNPHDHIWTIKVRVSEKGRIIDWAKGDRRGRLCNVSFIDVNGDEINLVLFNDDIERYRDLVEVGKTYYISRGAVKYSRSKYSKNKIEIHVKNDQTMIQPADEEDQQQSSGGGSSIPLVAFKFKTFTDLQNIPDKNIVDVFGRVEEIHEIEPMEKFNTVLRRVDIVNFMKVNETDPESLVSISCTFWGDRGRFLQEKEGIQVGCYVALKCVRKGSFKGINLSAVSSTRVFINPNGVEEIEQFKQKLEQMQNNQQQLNGGDSSTEHGSSLSQKSVRIDELLSGNAHSFSSSSRNLGGGFKDTSTFIYGDTFEMVDNGNPANRETLSLFARVVFVDKKKPLWYNACPNTLPNGKKCQKKLEEISEGSLWSCKRCNTEFSQSSKRFLFNFQCQDHTGSEWVTVFHERAIKMIKKSPEELEEMRNQSEEEFERYLDKMLVGKGFLFFLRAQKDQYRDFKLKLSVISVNEVDYEKENKKLIDMIKYYEEN